MIIFDFDDIRHRRNQMLGLEPNGRVFDEKGRQIVEADVFFDVPRPLAWRMTQHRAAEHQKFGATVKVSWDLGRPLVGEYPAEMILPKGLADKFRDMRRGSERSFSQIPEWFTKAYADNRTVYRFLLAGSECIVRSAVIRSDQDGQKLMAVEVQWSDNGVTQIFDGDVFLKNFKAIEARK